MYTKITEKDQPQIEPVYEQGKDYFQVLHQIVVDVREDADRAIKGKWGIPFKSLKHCNVKLGANGALLIIVFELHGGFRVRNETNEVLQKRAMDTRKLLGTFEKELKKEFKKRTKKDLKLSKGETQTSFEQIAQNGLYRFWAVKTCEVKTELDGQEYKESLKGDF
jgi:hypothetical protein